MERYYYAIIERSYNFCVLETGWGEHERAWERANRLQAKYPNYDVDVLVFVTEQERIEYIRGEAITGKDYRELYNKMSA